ncbi:MAG: PIN domain-containing protein [Duganella sp.]
MKKKKQMTERLPFSVDHAEINLRIQQKAISAITVDTTVFDDNGMRLDRGLFSQLLQFGRHPANLIISEVVLREITRHLTNSINTKKERLGRDMSDAADFVGFDLKYVQEIKDKFRELPDSSDLCKAQVDKFLDVSGTIVVEAADHIDVSDVLKCYFDAAAPFHHENPKKKEFPDAIALLSLEAWAVDEETEMVVVSRDSDWEIFCDRSEKLHLVKDLATALAMFQTPDEVVNNLVESLRSTLNDPKSDLFLSIEKEIREFDWVSHATSDIESQFQCEEDDADVEIKKCVFEDRPDAIAVTDIDEEAVSVIFAFQVAGEYIANFSFQKWDSIDKEYISMGGGSVEQDFDVSVSVVLRIPNKSTDPEDMEWEIEPLPLHFYLGELEPDWMSGHD